MPYRKEQFETDKFYHIIVRAIDNNLLFKDIEDYFRGFFGIYEFNNSLPVVMRDRRAERKRLNEAIAEGTIDPVSVAIKESARRDKFVEVVAICLMPNHMHLLVHQIKDGGITKFMHKLNLGIGSYFNTKYHRKGPVFLGRFLAIPVLSDEQLKVTFVYIHTNPVALIEPGWKEKGIADSQKAIEFIENYKWSSYMDFLGKKNFPSVTERDFLLEIMGGLDGCRKCVNDWIAQKEQLRKMIAKIDEDFRKSVLITP